MKEVIKLRYDLHIHSKYSCDGYCDPKVLVKTAIKKGLSGIAVTDHNTLKGGLKTKKYETNDFHVIVGSEVSTNRGEVIGLFLTEEIKSNIFTEVIEDIEEQNGIVITPHPFDDVRGNGINLQKQDVKLVDFVEVFNSRCLLQKYNDKAYEFAVKNNLKFTAGSDAHFANEIGKAGIITPDEDIRESFSKDNIDIFGAKSNPINLGLTKVLKIWRKASSG